MTIAHGTEYQSNFEAISDVLHRNSFLQLQRGAEIGVRDGHFSEYLLRHHPQLTLYLVDPYAAYQDVGWYYTASEQALIKDRAVARLSPFGHRAAFRVEPSLQAADSFCDADLDFVFIDAEHTAAAVGIDIQAWLPKVRLGGLLCGHDYHMHPVRQVVDTFASWRQLQVEPISAPADVWMIRIPGVE